MAAPVTAHVGHVIAGVHHDGGVDRIEVRNPATEQVIGSIPAGTPAEVDAAVTAATDALPAWSATPVADRVDRLRAVSAGLAARGEQLAASITAEMGAPTGFARKVQAGLPVATSAGMADVLAEYSFSEEIGNSLVLREPIGVVGCITPWNFPLHQIVAKVVPALAAGCTVVLKPSELAPSNANILLEVLAEAGIPAGAVNLVHGLGPVVGEAIAAHPGLDMVSFTGSTRAGRRVSVVAAATVKKVALELGGKSANVILDDADLAVAVKVGVANALFNAGQTCTAWTRMLVPADRHDEALELAVAAAAKYTVGDPTEPSTRIGPVVSAAARDRIRDYIHGGLAQGATLAVGGADPVEGLDTGYYVRPTIFGGVTPEMTIATEEIFGPVLSVLPYTGTEDAIRIANSTIYGLAGGVFGADTDRAMAVAKRLRTGQVDVNGGAFNPIAPFGGYRQSGNGREYGRYGMAEFLEVKSIQR